MSLGEYNGAGSGTTKLLLHLNGNSTDTSGNSNSGTDTAITYSQANGKFGQGAGFNGSSSKIIPGTTGIPTYNSAITLSCWVKLNVAQNSSALISRWAGSNYNWLLNDSNFLVITGTSGGFVTPVGSLSTGIWYLITATWDGSNNASNVKTYINGTLSSTGASWPYGSGVATNSVVIGSQNNGTQAFFNGSIDEVIIENRAWSASEVKKYYTMTKGRFGII